VSSFVTAEKSHFSAIKMIQAKTGDNNQ